LLFELEPGDLAAMAAPQLAAALAEFDLVPPPASALPDLAARWFELFLQPGTVLPPVQSLWQEGRYDGAATVAVRQLAAAAGLQWGATARGAPPDHLGCLLLLWAELVVLAPPLAAQLVQQHLDFAPAALREAARDAGFHGAVARAVLAFVAELQGESGR
jgi:TorA maturation chaperone TorD